MSHVFISYRKTEGDFAELIKSEVERAGFDTWMDLEKLEAGQDWRQVIDQAICDSIALIVVMTPDARASEYVTYEWAYALGTGIPVIPVLYKETPMHPRLEALQYLDMTRRPHNWDRLIKRIRNIQGKDQNYAVQIKKSSKDINKSVNAVMENFYFRRNRAFQYMIIQSVNEMNMQLYDIGTGSRYYIPATQYPRYLISIQRQLRAIVRGVALVDQEERFWQDIAGREISRTAHKDAIRIFVFTDMQQFTRNFETLQRYATRYKVYAISFDFLAGENKIYAKDFAIIEVDDDKVVAEYDNTANLKNIRFSADIQDIAAHEEAFNQILRSAIQILPSMNDPDQIIDKVFANSKLSPFRYQPIEMSDYIVIEDYDQYEEKHAYYQDMMMTMIKSLQERTVLFNEPLRILELGAGTGIFTKRLIDLSNVDIVALEIDWVCFNKLQHKMSAFQSKIQVHNKDSRTYNPSGDFQFIFSSFSEHHIKPEDKTQYFENVKRNLIKGGFFIIGDEFLPDYDANNPDEWNKALHTYHNHIIKIAEQAAKDEMMRLNGNISEEERLSIEYEAKAHLELAKLEQGALMSGLARKGDFKISNRQYEQHLRSAGFEFIKQKIGPLETDNVGGIYVYVAWIPSIS